MKKIAIVAHGLSGGGAERVASILANYFDDNGYEVLYIAAYSSKREYELSSNIAYEYIDVSGNAAVKMIKRSIAIYKLVKKFGADCAFSFFTNELIPLALSRIPVIPSLRIDPSSTDSNFVKSWIRRFVYRHSKNVVFQTQEARDYFEQRIRDKGVVISNPIKENLPEWNMDSHSNYFMTACRISTQKNIPMMIDAFCRFHEVHPEYTLDIYGDGEPAEYKDSMVKYAEDKGASDYIHFMGHSTDIHALMQNAQGFLLTSDFEGMSNSMLEAMAIGLPAICTDCPPGGARMFIDNEKSGLLVPVGGVDELYGALCKLVENPALQKEISQNSRYVRKSLDKNEICSQWERLV